MGASMCLCLAVCRDETLQRFNACEPLLQGDRSCEDEGGTESAVKTRERAEN